MSLRNSFLLSLLEKYSSLVITFVSSIIIARLLSPEEIGIFSVTVAFTSLAHMLRDFGVGDYLIKEKELTREKIGTVLGIAILLAWSIGVLLLLLAPYISDFYEEPGIRNVFYILSASFFIIPFSSPILPVLRRKMQFDKLLRINLTSHLMHAVSAVTFAYNGLSYMSLAWASLVSVLTTFTLAQYYRPIETKVMPRLKEYKEILSFGGTVSLGMLISEFGRNAPELIIGKVLDFGSVGIFNRGRGLVKLFQTSFLGAIAPVIQSEFAEQYRNGRDVRGTYYKSIEYVTVITWPVYVFVAAFSEEIILLLFGNQWTTAAPLATGFCLSAIISSLFSFAPKLLIASGEAARITKIVSITELVRVIFTFIGAKYALIYIVWSFSLVALISFFLHSHYLNRYYKVEISQVLKLSLKSLAVTLLSIAPSVLVFIVVRAEGFSLFFILSATFATLAVAWCSSIYLVNHTIKTEITKLLQKCAKASFR